MSISRLRPTPLYVQLKNKLQDLILMGELGPGVLLPSEMQLCKDYGVSRITVRRALDELTRMDLIERVQGKGSIVKGNKIGQSQSKIQGFTKSLTHQGYKSGGKLLEKELVEGKENLVSLFELPKTESHQLWRFRRLRYLNDKPAVIMNVYVRKHLGDRMLNYDLDSSSFYSLYIEITQHMLIDSRAIITAVTASHDTAQVLNIYEGAPLIWFQGITYTEGHVPIEVNYSLFLGEMFQFETKFYEPLSLDINERVDAKIDREEVLEKT